MVEKRMGAEISDKESKECSLILWNNHGSITTIFILTSYAFSVIYKTVKCFIHLSTFFSLGIVVLLFKTKQKKVKDE